MQAQSTPASGSSDGPPKAGEASNQTRGVPNAVTTNSPVSEVPISTKDAVRQGASGMGGASATTPVPGRSGEASTMTGGQPNAIPNDPLLGKSRTEVRDERAARRMGNTGDRATVGVPATMPAGSLSVFQGGTPE